MKNETWVARDELGSGGSPGMGRGGVVDTKAGPRGGDYEGWVARGGFKIGKIRGLGCKK